MVLIVGIPYILQLFLFYRLNVLTNCVEKSKSQLWTSLKYVRPHLRLGHQIYKNTLEL